MVISHFVYPFDILFCHPFVFVRVLTNNDILFLREKNALHNTAGEEEREIWMSIEHLTNGAEKRNKGR